MLMRWLDQIPMPLLWLLTILMLGAPFVPEPHLLEKWQMFLAGTLTRPIDWFDVIWHLLPATLLLLRLWRKRRT